MSENQKHDPTLVTPVHGAPLVQPPPTVGAYAIERLLGRGGMAAVYLARDRRSNRQVAVKLMNPSLGADPNLVERFLREAKTSASLRHRNVVEVLAFGESAGWFYLASELVEGGTVTALLQQMGEMPTALAIELFGQILEGLQHAHDAGLVHRDMKPDNLLLTPAGVLKIADFGIARATDSAKLTRTGMLIGTAAYMSPEQARGEDVDARSDLFSAGIVLYEMLHGSNPFQTDSVAASVNRIINYLPPPLHLTRPAAPHELEALLDTLLVADRAARCESARAALELLKPLLTAQRVKFPQLIADCLKDPKARRQGLDADAALALVTDARAAIGDGSPLALNRAAIKLQQALAIDPANSGAKQLWDALKQHVKVSLTSSQNPKVAALQEQAKSDPHNASVFAQLAQLYQAEGDLMNASASTRRYLRLAPSDTYAAQQLFQLTGETARPTPAARPSAPRVPPRASAPRAPSPQAPAAVPAEASPFAPPVAPVSTLKRRIAWLAAIGVVLIVSELVVWWVARKLEQWDNDTRAAAVAKVVKPPKIEAAPVVAEPDVAGRFDQAVRAERRGDVDGAIAGYRALKDEFPDRVEGKTALFRLGLLFLQQARNSEASDAFSEYLEKNPEGADATEALLRRGQAAAKNLDDKQALADFDELTSQNVNNAYVNEAWVLRGELKARKGDVKGARSDFAEVMKRVATTDPLYVRASDGKAKLETPAAPPPENSRPP